MKLYLYFARRFAVTLLSLLAIFIILTALLEMIEALRRFDSAQIGFLEILKLTFLKVPSSLYEILPLVVILSTLLLFLNLAKTSELVVARAAGRSALRSLVSPILVALLMGILTVAVLNPVVATTIRQYDLSAQRHLKGQSSILSISREGLWLRQGSETGQTVIRATRANFNGTTLFDVTFLGFDRDSVATFRIEAESATLTAGAWVARNAKQWRFDAGGNAELKSKRAPLLNIETNLTPEQILDSFGPPISVPIWQLPEFIERLDHAGFSSRRHRVWLQTELALPVLMVTMVMIGAGFTMRHTRFGRTGIMVLLALGMGFSIFFIRNFAAILGENGQLPILLAAWAPPAAGILMATGLLLHMEDG